MGGRMRKSVRGGEIWLGWEWYLSLVARTAIPIIFTVGKKGHKSRAMRKKWDICWKRGSRESWFKLVKPFPSPAIFVFLSYVFVYFLQSAHFVFPSLVSCMAEKGSKLGWAQLGGTLSLICILVLLNLYFFNPLVCILHDRKRVNIRVGSTRW